MSLTPSIGDDDVFKSFEEQLKIRENMTAKAAISPLLKLANGNTIPALGLGTWKSKPGEVYDAVKYAILEAGYRHIDCAFVYQNEDEVGKAVSEVVASGAVKREELFITSKLWNTFHSRNLVKGALETTLKSLQLDYLDLYLIHWPFGFEEGGDIFPRAEDGVHMRMSDVDFLDSWKGMEEVLAAGLTKSIGVSNFNEQQIQRIFDEGTVRPVVNQIELHPYLVQEKLVTWCKDNNVLVTAYSPLGSPDRPWAKADDPSLLQEPKILEIAAKYEKSAAQVLIRWQIQRGLVVIPKSVTPERISSNIDVFKFALSAEELVTIAAFDRNHRFVGLEHMKGHKYYPF